MNATQGVPGWAMPLLEALVELAYAPLDNEQTAAAWNRIGEACAAALASDAETPQGEPGWTQVRCVTCSGHGVVSVYSAHDFEGPGECAHCGGSGAEWVSPRGRTALYPGGPFTGSLPRGKEAVS